MIAYRPASITSAIFSSTIDKNYIEMGQRQWLFDCHWKRIDISVRTKNLVSEAATMHLIFFEIYKSDLWCEGSMPLPNMVSLPHNNLATPSPPKSKGLLSDMLSSSVGLSPGNLHQYPPYKMCMCHITGTQNLVLQWRPPQVIQNWIVEWLYFKISTYLN